MNVGLNRPAVRSKRRWLKTMVSVCIAALFALAAIYGAAIYSYQLGGTFFLSAKWVGTSPCPHGDRRIELYRYANGAGYVELIGANGRVLNQATFSEPTSPGPFRWTGDCKAVTVGTDDGLVDLTAR